MFDLAIRCFISANVRRSCHAKLSRSGSAEGICIHCCRQTKSIAEDDGAVSGPRQSNTQLGGKFGVGTYSPAHVVGHGLAVEAVHVVECAGINGDDDDGTWFGLGLDPLSKRRNPRSGDTCSVSPSVAWDATLHNLVLFICCDRTYF